MAVKILSTGGIDPNHVFEKDGRVYRKLIWDDEHPRWEGWITFMFSEVFKALQQLRYVPAHSQPSITEDGVCSMDALRVERIHPVTHVTEWTQRQIAEAILNICRMNLTLELAGSEFRAADCHVGNVTFTHGKPIYLDAGSFIKNGGDMMDSHLKECGKLIGLELSGNLAHSIHELLRYDPKPLSTEWDSYANADADTAAEKELLLRWLKRTDCHTVFDAGANSGEFSRVMAGQDYQVVSADVSEVASDFNRGQARRGNLPITTAFIDLKKFDEPIISIFCYSPWTKRLACDAAVASSLTHHLYRQGMKWQRQAQLWNLIARDWLLIEFVDRTDDCLKTWELDANYTREQFLDSLSSHWEIAEAAELTRQTRSWYLMKRKP